MIRIQSPSDINGATIEAIAYQHEPLTIDAALLHEVDNGRERFLQLIANGVPCYGVSTGLGRLAKLDNSELDDQAFTAGVMRARASAIGDPLPPPAARAMLVLRLVNFLSGRDGVSSALCEFIVARLNDHFTPWVPVLGHGMAGDATANSHAFQTLVGAGFVFGAQGERQAAAEALQLRAARPYQPDRKEALALINGVCGAPAFALHVGRALRDLLEHANLVAAASLEAAAAPLDSIDGALEALHLPDDVAKVATQLRALLRGSEVTRTHLQHPVSFRVTPQVHAALGSALTGLHELLERSCIEFSGNPVLVGAAGEPDRLLSVGCFHSQHLVNQVEHTALALAHVGCLSERRLHRLLDTSVTGLNAQLAPRPGLDAGLVTAQKAALDPAARLRVLAQPVSLLTGESSAGQEDYMSLAFPAIERLRAMIDLTRQILAYELLAALTAIDQRGEQPGEGVARLHQRCRQAVPALNADRSPGPDVEALIAILAEPPSASGESGLS